MNKDTLNTIFKKSFISLAILLLIRIGTFLPVPGINHTDLGLYLQTHSVAKNLVNTFSGDNTFVIGLFTLNIFPYINASIFIQLLLGLYPKLSKLQKEGGLEGRRKINRLTRLITLGWAIIQSLTLAFYLRQVLFDWSYSLALEIVIWLTSGSMIVLWLSEVITDYGLGNGASLLIYTNIISNLPKILNQFIDIPDNNFSSLSKLEFGFIFGFSFYGIILLQQSFRKVPLLSSKQLNQESLQITNEIQNYIPLRFNQAGVMPIILATAILIIPSSISKLLNVNLPIIFESINFLYWIVYFILVLTFSSFYSTIVLNPKDISDQLQKMAVTIPGKRPGVQTNFYLKQLMKRITLIGSIILAILTTLPSFLESTLKITNFSGLSATSLLILAGVILDLSREIENIYYSNIYNNMY